VLFYSHLRGFDYSLLCFTPDWQPTYFPIAQVNKSLPAGTRLHSTGCDGAGEVAHYDVEVVGMRGRDLVTMKNSPRRGRSGGGLISDDGYYVGICWGSTDVTTGSGVGLFTPLPVIHEGFGKNGYGRLLGASQPPGEVSGFVIPVIDRNNPQGVYPKDYIPVPNR
jgi:hypothetical protein